jgi:hypothetical protein
MPWQQYKTQFARVNPYLSPRKRQLVQMRIMIPHTVQYTAEEIDRMKRFADEHLGDDYWLTGYFRQHNTPGRTHCSEYVADVLIASGRFEERDFGLEKGFTHKCQSGILYEHLEPIHAVSDWGTAKQWAHVKIPPPEAMAYRLSARGA